MLQPDSCQPSALGLEAEVEHSGLCSQAEAEVEHVVHEAAEVCVEAEAQVGELVTRASEACLEFKGQILDDVEDMRKSLNEPEDDQTNRKTIVDSVWFHTVFISITLINALQLGVEADYPDWTLLWSIFENIFTAAFTLELVIKLCLMRRRYFSDKANWLDGALATLGVLDCWILGAVRGAGARGGDLQSLSVLRVLRLSRVARLSRLLMFKPLVCVIHGVIHAMSSAVYVFSLLACIVYVFAIFVTEHLGKPESTHLYPGSSTDMEVIDEMELMMNYNPDICFGSMLSSMFTLFNMVVGGEWTEIVRPIAIKQPMYLPLFLFFAIFVGVGVMNVLTSMVVDLVASESRKIERKFHENARNKKLKVMDEIEKLLPSIDLKSDGVLDVEELAEAMRTNQLLKGLLEGIDFPRAWEADELLDMLDTGGDGKLQHDEFVRNFFRLLESDDFQQMCIMHASINQVKHLIRSQDRHFEARSLVMAADIASIKRALGIAVKGEHTKVQTPVEAPSQQQCHAARPASSPVSKKVKQRGQEIKEEGLAGSTPHTSLMPRVSESTSRVQLEQALGAALAIGQNRIHEEFAAISSSLDAALRDFDEKSYSFLASGDEKPSPCLFEPLSASKKSPAGRIGATANFANGSNGFDSVRDLDSAVPDNRDSQIKSEINGLQSSKSSSSTFALSVCGSPAVLPKGLPCSL